MKVDVGADPAADVERCVVAQVVVVVVVVVVEVAG